MWRFVVPGLLAPGPALDESPPLPVLDRLLARGDHVAGPEALTDALFQAFAVPPAQRRAAPFCWLGITGECPEGWVVNAHPVRFLPDRDQLLLFPVEGRLLSESHAVPFLQAFNEHFQKEGLRLLAPRPDHWFLFLEGPVEARFTELAQAQGRPLHHCMPRGRGARRWIRLINEVQMLFHSLAWQRGEETVVNGLWFDGAGSLPARTGVAPEVERNEDECLLHGLRRHAAETDASQRLVLIRTLEQARVQGDAVQWQQGLRELERLLADAQAGGGSLSLETCDGRRWLWRPAMRWRVWRRARPLRHWCETDHPGTVA
jgi:hypothetical protein